MGVLNITPDSFSDGGEHFSVDAAVARAATMAAEGADIIDVGPESTRPGADPVEADEQIARAVPAIRSIRAAHADLPISIDTRFAAVARAALEAGADVINDTSALRDDPELAAVAARAGVPIALMHRRGTPKDMQAGGGPEYGDVVEEVRSFLLERVEHAVQRGIDRARIIVDPGIGFGKRVEHNLTLLRELHRLVELGLPVLVGASRKRFIGAVLGVDDPRARKAGSLACAAAATMAGAAVIRAHDVRATVEVVRMCMGMRAGRY